MAINTTGLAQPGDYLLGRGIVYASTLAASIPDGNGWRDLGNAPEFAVTVESETLEHVSSREGLQVTDKEVVLSQTMKISFTLDEINDENLALFFQGATATHTNPAELGFAVTILSASCVLARWYDIIEVTTLERAYDMETADVLLENTTGPVTLVEGTDYTIDLVMGRVFLLSTASNISAGDSLQVTVTAEATASSVQEVAGLTVGNTQLAIKFITENPASSNKQREYQFHTVTLASEGDYALIGQEFATMGFSGTVESNVIADANAPFVRVRDHAQS